MIRQVRWPCGPSAAGGALAHLGRERVEAVPRDGGLEGLGEDARRDQVVAQVGGAQEGVAPGTLGLAALLARHAAVVGAQLEGARHPGLDRVARRLEAEHQQGLPVRRGAGEGGFAGVEQAAVGGVEARLGQRPHRLRPLLEAVEQQRGRLLEAGRLLHTHPGLGDHAEDALGADQHPVRARTRPGARQAPALPGSRGRERPHRLDEVVDVRVERGVVAAGAGGDPAAERRVLEGLRVVTQRQPVRLQLLLQRGARGPRLDARGAGDRIDVEHPIQSAEVDRDRRRLLHARLHSADDAGAAAVGDRGRVDRDAPFEHALEVGLVGRVGDHVGRVVEAAAQSPHQVAVGLAVGVGGARIGLCAADRRQRRRWLDPGRRELQVLQPRGVLDVHRLEAQMLASAAADPVEVVARDLLILVAPAPELAPPLEHSANPRTSALPLTFGWPLARRPCKSACPRWANRSRKAPCSAG